MKNPSIVSGIIIFCLSLAAVLLGVFGTGVEMTFQWPAFLLLAVASLFCWTQWRPIQDRDFSRACVLSTLALVGYVVWRAWQTTPTFHARLDICLIGSCLLVYGLTITMGSRLRGTLVTVLLIVATIGGFIGVYHYFRDPLWHILPGYSRTYDEPRAGGFFNNPNHFAGYLEIILPFTVALLFIGKAKPWVKVCLVYVAIFLTVVLVLTVSRGAILGIISGFLILGLLVSIVMVKSYDISRKVVFSVGGGLLILGLIGLFGAKTLILDKRTNFLSSFTLEDARWKMWQVGVDQFKLSPAIGTGSRSYVHHARKLRPDDWQVYKNHLDPVFAHNDYVQFAAEYGYVGLTFFAIFIVAHLFAACSFLSQWFQSRRRLKEVEEGERFHLALCLGALGVVAAYAIHSIFDFNLHIPANAVLVAFVFAILAAPSAGFERSDAGPGRKFSPVLLLLLLAMTAFSIGFLIKGPGYFSAGVTREKARLAAARKDHLQGIYLIKEAIKKDPQNFDNYLLRAAWRNSVFGQITEQNAPTLSFLRKAMEDYEDVVELYPENAPALLQLARSYDSLGEYEKAEEHYQMALEWAPKHKQYQLAYGDHFQLMGWMKRDLKHLQEASRLYTAYGERFGVLQSLTKRLKDVEMGIEQMRAAEEEEAAAPSTAQ